MWSPKLGTFLSVDQFSWHDPSTTLWGWPSQNAIRWGDPFGRGRGAEDGRSGFNQFLFDLSPGSLDATAGFGTGLLDNIPIWGVPGSPTLGDVSAQLGLAGQHPGRAGPCAGGGGGGNDAANAGRVGGHIACALALGAAKGGGGGPPARAAGGGGGRFTADQQALVDLAKGAQRTGIGKAEAEALRELAEEYGLPGRNDIGAGHWIADHIHSAPVNHIPVIGP